VKDVGSALAGAARTLAAAGIDTPHLDARMLLQWASGRDMARLISDPQAMLQPEECHTFKQAVKERAQGRPVARIVGAKEFWGLEFALSAETLVPRPDTETLVEAVLAELPGPPADWRGRICDLGTGSGAILIALMSELPQALGVGVDLSADAIATARENANRHGVADRTNWLAGDYAAMPEGLFDIVVSNPPYVAEPELEDLPPEVGRHDPLLALSGGVDGLDAYRVLAARLPALIHPGGFAALEIGLGQAEMVTALTMQHGLERVFVKPDIAGIPRVLLGWNGPTVAPLPHRPC
jgi:release factor glutamine methyltransferase